MITKHDGAHGFWRKNYRRPAYWSVYVVLGSGQRRLWQITSRNRHQRIGMSVILISFPTKQMDHERWLQTLWSQEIILISWPNIVVVISNGRRSRMVPSSIHSYVFFPPLRSLHPPPSQSCYSCCCSSSSFQKLLPVLVAVYNIMYTNIPFMGVCCYRRRVVA